MGVGKGSSFISNDTFNINDDIENEFCIVNLLKFVKQIRLMQDVEYINIFQKVF